jgi:hypothetical protein
VAQVPFDPSSIFNFRKKDVINTGTRSLVFVVAGNRTLLELFFHSSFIMGRNDAASACLALKVRLPGFVGTDGSCSSCEQEALCSLLAVSLLTMYIK